MRKQSPKHIGPDKISKSIRDGFAKIHERFNRIDERFGVIEARIEQRFALLNERLNTVDARLGVLEQEVGKVKNLVLDAQEEVASLNTAIENDARRYFDHDQRIKRLEKSRV